MFEKVGKQRSKSNNKNVKEKMKRKIGKLSEVENAQRGNGDVETEVNMRNTRMARPPY